MNAGEVKRQLVKVNQKLGEAYKKTKKLQDDREFYQDLIQSTNGLEDLLAREIYTLIIPIEHHEALKTIPGLKYEYAKVRFGYYGNGTYRPMGEPLTSPMLLIVYPKLPEILRAEDLKDLKRVGDDWYEGYIEIEMVHIQ